MNTFMAIMSQLFWGVTIGALSAAFQTLAKAGLVIACLGGGGWFWFKRRKDKRNLPRTPSQD